MRQRKELVFFRSQTEMAIFFAAEAHYQGKRQSVAAETGISAAELGGLRSSSPLARKLLLGGSGQRRPFASSSINDDWG
ncbi:hypothetical protein [Elstera cyanobacteriorum]|uniref:hypothetical protein n=1 Tax=Elstera cyanobacteriorum TaxID=2022747 RepID=UPI001140744A|nr:hypothetical protein [Elstera cyanobacteriorum]MCK6444706.1 hypothetical protein [Elstera cyanobacteriorum]